MYAIIRDRGKQYTVREGDTLDIDRREVEGESVTFDEVLLLSNDDAVKVGTPTVSGAKVTASLVGQDVKGPKIVVMRFRRRKDSQKKTGHRQRYTRIKIDKIEA